MLKYKALICKECHNLLYQDKICEYKRNQKLYISQKIALSLKYLQESLKKLPALELINWASFD